ncbi:MAG: DUF6600 domain-containing protein [Burkholderiales bacterium]
MNDRPGAAAPSKLGAIALAAIAFLVCAIGAGPLRAQGNGDPEDLPARVGRIADLGGVLHHAPEDRASDWAAIGLNYPITTGDNLWVGEGGRAEIDVGAGQVRLGGETNVHFSRLDDRTIAFFVAQGRAILRLRVLDPGEVARIDTPNTQVSILRPGLYRVDVAAERTVVVVREGEAVLPVPGGMQQVLPGQTAVATGLDYPQVSVRHGVATDGFDTWSANRDRRYERSRSATYVSRQMIGYADLDEYGRWESDTTYGAVWYPTLVDTGWAPYRTGRWTWVRGFGWTWVDEAPWGYAPFHYGRWVVVGGRWGWCPGGYVARPYWAPAMVGWLGGAGWGLSVGVGGPVYGWVPLAWGEPFRPWWNNCSTRCWTWYNRPYAVREHERPVAPPSTYEHTRHVGAVTVVPGAVFTGSKPVRENLVVVRADALSAAPLLSSAPGIAKPDPRHIPTLKPGFGSTPPPASTFYATGRNSGSPQVKPGGGAPSAVGASGAGSSPYPVGSASGASKPMPSSAAPVPRPATGGQPFYREGSRAGAPPAAAGTYGGSSPGSMSGGSAGVGASSIGGAKPGSPTAPRYERNATPVMPSGGASMSSGSSPGAAPAARIAPAAPPPPVAAPPAPPKPAATQESARREAPRGHEGRSEGNRGDGGRGDKPGPGR